jgi:enoyl-[acyl-carrier protein] reductase III
MPDTLPFEGKITLITGSGRGIGRAIAIHFARLGSDIIINFFRNRSPAEETAAHICNMGRRAIVVKADIGNLDDLNRLFSTIDTEFGGLDILIHNAASGYNRPVMDQKPKGWEWTLNINARALLFAAQKAVPLMKLRGGGAIVSISSPGSGRVLPDYSVVGASKAALEALTRYLAVELSPYHIVVNAISPGVVLTDALRHFDVVRSDEHIVARALEHVPAQRLVTPEDVAGVAEFLCSPKAEMIRGQVVTVDGGATLLGPGVKPPTSDILTDHTDP